MRVDATLPDSRGHALDALADERGPSRSRVVDEAVGLFLKAVLEARRGHRLVTLAGDETACELSTPTLAALEWTARSQPLVLSDSEGRPDRRPAGGTGGPQREARAGAPAEAVISPISADDVAAGLRSGCTR